MNSIALFKTDSVRFVFFSAMNSFVEVHMLSIFIVHAKDEDETNDESV